MWAEIIMLVLALLFLMMAIFLFNGKGKWLIAGYNTVPKEEKEQYDEKKLCRAVSLLCIICCVMLCVIAYIGYRADLGMIKETAMPVVAMIALVVILTSVILVSVYINTKAKK